MMTSLKLLVVCCFIGITFARTDEELKKWFMDIAVECSKEHKVTSDELKQMKTSNKVPESFSAKCLVACIFKRIGWINDKGMFDLAKAYELSEREYGDNKAKLDKAKELYEICKTVNDEKFDDGEKGCKRSNVLATCMIENAPKLGFTI
ncbi:unnamed protein product, partial [Brenthis ino]